MVRPLEGVRVLDLTRLLPGGFCTLVLADLGADVIKIEDPHGGDPLRAIPPYHHGTSVYFHALNRNKRSVTLDLRSAEARAVLDRLITIADVLVESFRPDAARRLGVSAPELLARHPRLVHCSLTGFGQTGPYAERPAHDLNFFGLAGLFEVDRCERVPRLLVTDVGGAWAAVAGIAAALFKRERTGAGSAVDISIHDVAVSWLTFPAASQLIGGSASADFAITDDQACYNVYTTADGRRVALAAIEQKFWHLFAERSGRLDFIPLQFAPAAQENLRQQVADVVRSRTLDEWLQTFADVDVCLTPVNTIAEAVAEPHLKARGMVVEHEQAKYVRSPIVFRAPSSGAADDIDPRPPVTPVRPLGADTEDVLREAGIDQATQRRLREKNVPK